MKNLFFILLAGLMWSSCKKDHVTHDNGCITQIARQNFSIKTEDSVTAITLLDQNHIARNDVSLQYVSAYTVPDGDNAGTYQSVFVIQNINGAPVLSGDVWYQFKNGILQSAHGTKYNVSNLDKRIVSSPSTLRPLFLAEVEKYTSASFAARLKDSCLVAEFGYYDLNATVGQAPNLVRAWRVMLKNQSFPQVVFRDDNRKEIIYDGGPVLF